MNRRGFTLIEVLAATVLAASLLAALLVARQRHAAQLRHAQSTLQATCELDQLVELWWSSQTGVPRPAQGRLPSGHAWQTNIVPDAMADDLQLDRIDVRIISQDERVAARLTLYAPAKAQRPEGGDTDAP